MFIKNIHLLITTTFILLLTGCENLPIKEPAPEPIEKPQQAIKAKTSCSIKCSSDTLKSEVFHWINNNNGLGFFQWLDQSIAENGQEIVALLSNEQTLNKNEPFTNLFLSLALSYPGTDFRNTNQALESLQVFEQNWLHNDQNKEFSLFLKRQLEDRKNMVEQRSELRKKLVEAKKELEKEQDNAVAAKTQLDQLKSVEKSLLRQQSEETKKYRVVK